MKTVLIVIGIIFVLIFVIFLYLLIAGADESRRRNNKPKGNEVNEKDFNGM